MKTLLLITGLLLLLAVEILHVYFIMPFRGSQHNNTIMVVIEKDSASFHVWNRQIYDSELQFTQDRASGALTDINTKSIWNMNGQCIQGPLAGTQLAPVRAYQEFWHSWNTFHPGTMQYR
jgi:hypothetical protein